MVEILRCSWDIGVLSTAGVPALRRIPLGVFTSKRSGVYPSGVREILLGLL